MTTRDRLAEKLNRLLVRRRFGPMVLWFSNGHQFEIGDSRDVRVDSVSGTITVSTFGGERELLFEELRAIELRPRSPHAAIESSINDRTKPA